MAAPNLLQSITAASAAAGPASITPTFGGASTAGNFLVLIVCVTGTTPSITTPGGWTSIRNNVTNAIAFGFFIFPNNPGGITSVAVTVGGTGGGAAAAMFEFTSMPNNISGAEVTGIFTSVGTPNPIVNVSGGIVPPFINELVFCALAFAAATVNSNANTPDLTNSVGNVVSTSGAPNAQLACFWGLSLLNIPTGGNMTLGTSVAVQFEVARFLSAFGQAVDYTPGSPRGAVWPPYYQGSIGIG